MVRIVAHTGQSVTAALLRDKVDAAVYPFSVLEAAMLGKSQPIDLHSWSPSSKESPRSRFRLVLNMQVWQAAVCRFSVKLELAECS